MLSKHPEEFGHGSIEAIAANEAAQNASNSGELIPTMALGIPGSSSMVLLLSALIIHGFLPGPMLTRNAPQLLYASIAGMLASTVFLLLTGWWMASMCLKAVSLNRQMVIVVALAMVVMGVYSLNANIFDVFVCGVCGIIGYFMIRYGYSTAAAALAVILGDGFERHLRFGLNITGGSWVKFLSRPITAFIVAGCAALLMYGTYRQIQFRRKMAKMNGKPD
jgi:putative tricarboxylic transport membrane protein